MLRTVVAVAALASLMACEEKSSTALGPQPMSDIEKICSRAYGGTEGFRAKQMQALTEEQKKQVQPMASKANYVKACSALTEDAARCLDPNLNRADPQGCEKSFAEADKAAWEAMKKVLVGGDVTPDEAKDGDAKDGEAKDGEAKDAADGAAKPAAGDMVKQAMEK